MPHIMGPAGAPPPPPPNEVKLLAEIAGLHTQLDECRQQRDENLANIRRIDDLRMREIRLLNTELRINRAFISSIRESNHGPGWRELLAVYDRRLDEALANISEETL